jgi:selenocysteine lyase/cysteine desulfurase
MEVSLLNTKAPRNVILSPYEHPSEDAVGMWLDKVQGVSYRRARFRPDLFAQNWSKQLPQVVNELASLIDKDVPSNILLISEVFYATGHVIPINDLVSELRKQHPELQVIVDGAHSAGNLDFVRPPAYARAYICSGHKWLMSPEPCGIRLVIRSVDEGLRSYDAWNEELPVTTASIRMIASLRASLEVLQSLGMGALHRRSKLLKEFFLSKIDQTKFQIVGSGNGLSDTFMVALAPNPGFAWAMKGVASIQKNLTAHGIELSFVDLDDDLFWIRVTFPFFVHRTDVEILSSCLNPLVIREFQTSAKVQSE